MWQVYIALIFALVYLLDRFLVDKRQLELIEKIDGPLRLPVLGNLLIALDVRPENFFQKASKILKTYSGTSLRPVKFWAGPYPSVGVQDPRHFEIIMTNPKFLPKASDYESLRDALGDGLIFSSGQKWFARRKIITPTFHFKILEQFFDVFAKNSTETIKSIEKSSEKAFFDIQSMLSSYAMNSIVETAMGCELKPETSDYFVAVRRLSELVAVRLIRVWLRVDFIHSFTSNKRETDECTKVMHNFTTSIIETRRKELLSSGSNDLEDLENNNLGLKKKMCLLDVLLQSTVDGSPLSNADIKEEVDTFTFAGHDTTVNVITFTLFAISKFPGVQGKIFDEIHRILGDEDLTFSKINEFKYLDLAIKETMRLYPPVLILARRPAEEVDMGDFIAPANVNYYMFCSVDF